MLNNVKQNEARMDGFMAFRINVQTLDGFNRLAERDGRTPSNLARKVITDFVRGGQLHAVPPPAAVQSAQQPQPQNHQPSPWDI